MADVKKAVQDIEVVPELVDRVPEPPETWIVRGPRGGHYLAIGRRRVRTSDQAGDVWMRGTVMVRYESESVRYLRPNHPLLSDVSVTLPKT